MTALGLVFVIEGLLYALAPRRLKHFTELMQQIPEETLRNGGIAAIALGVGLVWIARTFVTGS